MKVQVIIETFQRMLEEKWEYVWGKAEEGVVDCSGAFVYAYRQHGKKIYHGSNRIARTEVVRLLPVSEAQPGMMAFKSRAPGEKGYNLPEAYKEGGSQYNGDPLDWYHIGLVDEDARYVLNARSPEDGFQRNRITDGWDAVGYAVQIDYDGIETEEEEQMANGTAKVTAQQGSTVNMRAAASKSASVLERVPIGDMVEVLKELGTWAQILHNGKIGYMMTEFLLMQGGGTDESLEQVVQDLKSRVEELESWRSEMGGVG